MRKQLLQKKKRHGRELVTTTTDSEHLNPNQVQVLVVDQPFNVQPRHKIQSTFLNILEEGKFVAMLGELHIAMALWSTMKDLLRESGLPEVLKEAAGLVKKEAAASHSFSENIQCIKTRYAHQVTIVVIDSLLRPKNSHTMKEAVLLNNDLNDIPIKDLVKGLLAKLLLLCATCKVHFSLLDIDTSNLDIQQSSQVL